MPYTQSNSIAKGKQRTKILPPGSKVTCDYSGTNPMPTGGQDGDCWINGDGVSHASLWTNEEGVWTLVYESAPHQLRHIETISDVTDSSKTYVWTFGSAFSAPPIVIATVSNLSDTVFVTDITTIDCKLNTGSIGTAIQAIALEAA